MKILVFSIDTSGKYAKDIFHDVENMIIYTGTHDNDTLMEWYDALSVAAKRKVRRFLAREGIRQGKAEYAIVPMADILGMGKEAHLNTPGTVGSPNWEWRMPDMRQMEISLKKYSRQMRQR